MGKRRKGGERPDETAATVPVGTVETVEGHDPTAGPDLSLVMPLALLAGGVAAYPSLSAAAEGDGDLLAAIILFLVVTLFATIGFGVAALMWHSFSIAEPEEEPEDSDAVDGDGPDGLTDDWDDDRFDAYDAEDGDGDGYETADDPLRSELDEQAQDIESALAPTDALVHPSS